MSATLTVEHLREIGLLPGGNPVEPLQPPPAAAKPAPKGKGVEVKTPKDSPDAAAPAPADPAAPVPQKTEAELAKMSKEERRAYHMARRASEQQEQQQSAHNDGSSGKLTKAQRREIQEAQRKAKEAVKENTGEFDELLKDLKLQGLTEEQARAVISEMKTGDVLLVDEDDDEPDDYKSCVRKWMQEQGHTIAKEVLSDFNMKVRFQGHVDSTAPDHLRAVLSILCEQACAECDLSSAKLQPTSVAKKAEPLFVRWAPLLEPLYEKIGDALAAADDVIQAVQEGVAAKGGVSEAGRACGVVGCLMGLREIDMIEDEDLLTGCKRSQCGSRVMDKFVEFLEEEVEGEEGSDDE